MTKESYCATHNTYPLPNEPCWQCANPFILKESDKVAELEAEILIMLVADYEEIDVDKEVDEMKLSKRLKHFEKHQMEQGDEYGAEVLYRAHQRITQLEAVNSDLLKALKVLLSHPSDDALDAAETDDGYFLSPLNIAEREARKLIRNAEEQS